MDERRARELIDIYARAWITQDPELILTVFTENATYNDPKEPIATGHAGIRDYWRKKVLGEQKDITFTLLHLWICNDMVIAEWNAKFTDTVHKLRLDMNEVALFSVSGERFSSLREYYKSQKTPL